MQRATRRSLATLLLQKKHIVYTLARGRDSQSSAAQDLVNKGAIMIKGDLNNPDSLRHAVKDIESVILMGTRFEDGT